MRKTSDAVHRGAPETSELVVIVPRFAVHPFRPWPRKPWRGLGKEGGDVVASDPVSGDGRGKRMALAVLAAVVGLLQLARAIVELIRTL